ncbi:MAG: PQQ-like beta-propeller repeat protein, partial [Planctomycetota bacterium]|nr:PQQ-like beta-propeller repeat protein [Planctomycetota bacterium]
MLTLSLTLVLALPATLEHDWPQVTGPNGDRMVATGINPSNLTAEAAWRVPTNLGFSSFAIADGRALTMVVRDVEGVQRECCVALDVASGRELWAQPFGPAAYDGGGGAGASDNKGGDGPRTTPVIVGDRVYVYDAHLVLHSLDAKSGKPGWQVDVLNDHEGRQIKWQNASAPVVAQGIVLVAGGGEGQTMLGVDARTGAVKWAHGDDKITHATPTPCTLHGREQVIFYLMQGLTSVDPKTGEVLWSLPYDFRTSSAASPVVHGDIVYVSAGYGVGAGAWRINKTDAGFETEFLWRQRNKLQNHWSTPFCKDGHLYGMFSFKKYGEGPLMCVELATGETRWSADGFGPGNAILVGDHVIALSDTGEVV